MRQASRGGGDGVGPVQPGLPGVLPEEAPLPSEVVLDGHVLDRRRREALAELRGLLIDRPDEFAPDEWRVAVASLAPPASHLGRTPGSPAARHGIVQVARDCYPGLSPTQAVARFREALRRPHVAAFLADVRALELLDVVDQRGKVRERLHQMLAMMDHVVPATAVDAEAGGNHCKAAMVAATAAKMLIDLDALAMRPEDVAAGISGGPDGDGREADAREVAAALVTKVEKVGADLRARRERAGAC